MRETLLDVLPKAADLLTLEPEELGMILLRVFPAHAQNHMVQSGDYTYGAYNRHNPSIGYEEGTRNDVELAIAEAFAWLVAAGLFVHSPGQPGALFRLTRRAVKTVKDGRDLGAYRKARLLPVELLQPELAEKVWPMFLRGDHDVAVFQAFKEVEMSVRRAATQSTSQIGAEIVGQTLMRTAFHPTNGPLTNTKAIPAEREAEMFLFAGAMGHAKNPTSHREVNLSPAEAARLIVFASHLLSIVAQR